MPGNSRVSIGNIILEEILLIPSLAYPAVPTGTFVTSTVTVAGLQLFDFVDVVPQQVVAHLSVGYAYVSALNTLSIVWTTDATGVAAPGSLTNALMDICRVDGAATGIQAFQPQVAL